MTIEMGIVGCGNAARGIHYPPLSKRPDQFRVTACCDLDPARAEEIAGLYQAKPYTDLNRFLEHPNLRLVLVATRPPSTHAPSALQALAAGKDVLLEKPMCAAHQEGVAIIEAARRHGRLVTVHQNRRWEPEFLELRWAVEQGLFGKVRIFHTTVCGNLLGADWLFDWGVHLFDQALLIGGGKPMAVDCAASFPHGFEKGSGPWTAVIRFDNGAAAVAAMMMAQSGCPRFMVAGDQGGCVWPGAKGRLKLDETTLTSQLPEICRGRDSGGEPLAPSREARIPIVPFYDNLYEALHGRAEPAVRPAESLLAVDVTLAAMESTRTGRAVQIV